MPPKRGRASSSKSKGSSSGFGSSSSANGAPHIIDVDEETWDIRGRAQNIFNPKKEYDGTRDKFSLAVHHGGLFVGNGYVGGLLNYVDNCTVRQFELLDLSSIMLKIGYRREYICEFYYCHPAYNDACHGTEFGPLEPLIDEEHLKRFKKLANKLERIVHVYVLEITAVEARAKQAKDQQEYMKDYFTPRSKGVVIEEIDEPPQVVLKQKPRKKVKVNPGIPLLEWYEKDVEFEDYLVSSLVKAREDWRKKEIEKERTLKNLMDEFSATVEKVVDIFWVLHV